MTNRRTPGTGLAKGLAAGLAAGLVIGLSLAVGWWSRGHWPDAAAPTETVETTDGSCAGGVRPAYWRAPMDPTFIREEPGKSPMGMDLIPVCPNAAAEEAPGVVHVDSATVQTLGVRTAPVESRDLSRTIRAVGRIDYDERRVAHVHTKVQGWVERLYVDFVGHEVKRGQPLLEIYSPELVATQEELLLAARYRDATAGSPFADVKSAGTSLFDATRRRLELWDISKSDIDRLIQTGEVERTLTLHAPSTGIVTKLAVRSGMEVSKNTNLYTIADLSNVWVVAQVYEFELAWLAPGQIGTVELGSMPGMEYSGPVTYISPFLDPTTRTAEVRLELPNPDGRLKPGMFGNALIRTKPRTAATAIPSEAIIRSGRRTLAIVALDEGRFAPRDVEIGVETEDGWTEVTSGLAAGDRVVVSSQFLIDSESKLQEAIGKLLGGSGEPKASQPESPVDPVVEVEGAPR